MAACQRCQSDVPAEAKFCPACGTAVTEPEGFSRAQLVCVAGVGLELLALAATALFVVPRMRGAIGENVAHHSAFTQLVFSPFWVPSFVLPVLILGAIAIAGRKSLASRMVLLSLCLIIGLIPIFGAAMGIYVATFETVMGEAEGK
jgi:type II secretory pathway component PulF